MEKVKGRITKDLLVVIVMVLITGAGLVWFDESNMAVLQAGAISIFLAGTTHITRRVMFNRIDLQEAAINAIKEKNVAAALVVVALVGFLIAVLSVSLSVLK